jgi:hypothetical protein
MIMHLNNTLADFYERDLRKLIDELNLFNNEENLWKTAGSVRNSAGNLILHIIGGLNFLIGATLANSGYIRNRDLEFSQKGIGRSILVSQLEALIPVIRKTLNSFSPQDLDKEFPIFFDKPNTTKGYVLVQLLAHLNYHLGQINYLRRIIETTQTVEVR